MIVLDKYCENSKDMVELSTSENIKSKVFELDENYMFKLNKANAQKAYECVCDDARYKVSPDKEYYEKLKNQGKSLANYTLDEIYEIIRLIAASNSTRSPNKSVKALAEYIYQNLNSVKYKLESGDISLADDLATVKMPRHEYSLISKICAYLCEYEFQKFNFIINDNVVRGILPYYLDYYNVEENLWKQNGKLRKFEKLSYSDIHNMILKIKNSLSENLTLRDIDHILWYCYKDDKVRTAIANEIVLKI